MKQLYKEKDRMLNILDELTQEKNRSFASTKNTVVIFRKEITQELLSNIIQYKNELPIV